MAIVQVLAGCCLVGVGLLVLVELLGMSAPCVWPPLRLVSECPRAPCMWPPLRLDGSQRATMRWSAAWKKERHPTHFI